MTNLGNMDKFDPMKKKLTKKEELKQNAQSVAVIVGFSFFSAAILFWAWPAILNLFPAIRDSGVFGEPIRYWTWFGFIWFVRTIRKLIMNKW